MTDFVRLLKDYNIDSKQEVDGWIQINCPFHDNGVRGYKGGLNLIGGYYHCWNCGGQSIKKVFSELLHISFYEAKKLLQEYDTESKIVRKVGKKAKRDSIILLPGEGFLFDKKTKAYKYLISRNFNPAILQQLYLIRDGVL